MIAKNELLKHGKNILFIGGPPRSGTTLIQRIMGAHSQVFAGPEFDFIPIDILKLRSKMLNSIQSGRIKSIVDEGGLDQAFQSFLCNIFENKLAMTQKSFFSEKTPANALVFPEIEKMLPDARLVMMIRDPRDIVNSLKAVREKYILKHKRPPRFVRSVAASVQEINRYYDAGLTAAANSTKIHLVYYEDLVRNPSIEVQKVCNHVGLKFEDSMLSIEENNFEGVLKNGDDYWYSTSDLQTPILQSGVVSRRKYLNKNEISLIELFTHQNPALKRYNMVQKKPTLRETLLWRISLAQKACVLCPR